MQEFWATSRRIAEWLLWRADRLLPGIGIAAANSYVDRSYVELRRGSKETVSKLAQELNGWPAAAEECRLVYEQELERRESIEKKAVQLFGVTGLVSVASVIAILIPKDLSSEGKVAVGVSLLVPLVCFFLGSFLSVLSWRIGDSHLVESRILSGLTEFPVNERPQRLAAEERLVATELNELLTLKRVNYVTSAESWMARGIFLFAAAAVALAVVAMTTDLLT